VRREKDKVMRGEDKDGRWRGGIAACGRIQGAWSLAVGGGEGGRNSGEMRRRETEKRQRRKRKGIFLGTYL
jgi:hypothetical protein